MIRVIDNWYLDADDREYILQEKKIKGKDSKDAGEEYFDVPKYPTTLTGALQILLNIYQRRAVTYGSEMTLSEALEKFEEINKQFKEEVLDRVHKAEKL